MTRAVCVCYAHSGFLTAKGLEEAAQRRRFLGVDTPQDVCELDKVGSVSGSRRDETTMIFDEGVIDEQHRRFLDPLELV